MRRRSPKLAGCSLGPRPAAPVPPTPAATWNGETDAAGWPSTDWWKAFGPTSIFDIGLNILQPIFDGGKMRGQLDLANGVYKERAADYLKAIHQAYGDVEDALASAQQAREQVARQGAATASAQRAVVMARAAFAAGTTDTITLLTAQQALAAAQAEQAQLGQAQGLVDLYKALGSGWQLQN